MFDPGTKQIDFESWLDPENYQSTGLGNPLFGESEPEEDAVDYYKSRGHTPEDHEAHHHHHHDQSGIQTFCITRRTDVCGDASNVFGGLIR